MNMAGDSAPMVQPQAIRLLMIDDSPDCFATLRALVAPRRGGRALYALSHVTDQNAGLAAMRDDQHDCYLVDYRLGGTSGLDLVRAARASGVARPIVMLTASDIVDHEAADAGANDFLVKGGFDRATLDRTIRYAIGNADSIRRLAELNGLLEMLVEERTRQYAAVNGSLKEQIAAREVAEAALIRAERLQALGRMTGSVAHDFNNILTALFGSLETLQRRLGDAADPRLARPLDNAVEAARRGARMVEGLLAFARQRPLAPLRVQINAVIRESEPLLRLTLGNAVDLEHAFGDQLPDILVDREQLERALLNLASNARDALSGRPGAIQAGARLLIETMTDARGNIALVVSDNGPGMRRDVLEHAFEPFFSTKQAGLGTGLGLAQVYGFAHQSGGTATIDSPPGAGVSVRIVLPAAPEPPA